MNPNIEVLVEYIGDDTTAFVNDVKGEALSTKMYDEGAEIVYHAAGLSVRVCSGQPSRPTSWRSGWTSISTSRRPPRRSR